MRISSEEGTVERSFPGKDVVAFLITDAAGLAAHTDPPRCTGPHGALLPWLTVDHSAAVCRVIHILAPVARQPRRWEELLLGGLRRAQLLRVTVVVRAARLSQGQILTGSGQLSGAEREMRVVPLWR